MVKVIRKAKIDINLGATHGILQADKSPSGTCLVTLNFILHWTMEQSYIAEETLIH